MSNIVFNNFPDNNILPFYFFTACRYHLQEDIIRPDGVPVFYQIIFVVEGKGILRCQGKTYELKKNCAFFNAPEIPIEYVNEGGLVTAFLSVVGSGIENLMKFFSVEGFLFYESVNLEKYIAEIEDIIKKHNTQKLQASLSAMVYSFFTEFFEEQNNTLSKIEEIVLYCDKNFTKKLTLEQLANIGCMSVSKLCHDFKSKYNISVFKYILNLRLNYAHTLLLSNTRLTIKEIALSSGFSDVSYFCRAYKEKFSKTPTEELMRRGLRRQPSERMPQHQP